MFALGYKYIRMYKTGEFRLEMLRTMPSVKSCVLSMYWLLVGSKEIKTIETLDQDMKDKLWVECKPFVAGLTVEQCRDFVRCYLALDCLAAKMEAGV